MTTEQEKKDQRKKMYMWLIVVLVLLLIAVGAWMYMNHKKGEPLFGSKSSATSTPAGSPEYEFKFY
jgi:flagellar basal body-associated protein FliL